MANDEVLNSLLILLNNTGLQKKDQPLYDFLRRLVRGTESINSRLSSVITSSSSSGGGGSVTNVTNIQQIIQYSEEGGDDSGGGAPGTQGAKGDTGATGPAGSVSLVMISDDPVPEDPIIVKGDTGLTGPTGAAGAAGVSIPILLEPDLPEDPIIIKGDKGDTGSAGLAGSPGSVGFPMEPELPEEPLNIPGPKGDLASMVDFTQDLGVSDSSGTFDITGLSGLTVDADVTVVQTAQPIASKGNARDEFEMDAIQLTGYVLNSTTIRVYWWSPNVVVGIYAFAFAVSPSSVALAAPSYLNYQDQKAQNTPGGTFTSGAWRTRDLNTEVADTGNLGTLSSNQITLAAGTYIVKASAPAYLINARHQIRLQNITDGVTLVNGQSMYAPTISANTMMTYANLSGFFTITSSKVLEIQHQCQATEASDGFGVASNFTTEVYTIVEFWKVG